MKKKGNNRKKRVLFCLSLKKKIAKNKIKMKKF